MAAPRRYTAAAMLAGGPAFRHSNAVQHLLNVAPRVWQTSAPSSPYTLDLGKVSHLAGERPQVLGVFNPSVVRAPSGLCPKCAYVLAVRADGCHQCSGACWPKTGQHLFKGSVIAVLDESMRTLAWTWFLAKPMQQICWDNPNNTQRVRPGAAGGFHPPSPHQVYDLRLLNFDGERIFAHYNCAGCDFAVSLLQLTCEVTPSGQPRALRAWGAPRLRARQVQAAVYPWAGRNHALFVADRLCSPLPYVACDKTDKTAPRRSLLVQPWIGGLVGTFGEPRFRTAELPCFGGAYRKMGSRAKLNHRNGCGLSPHPSTARLHSITNLNGRACAPNECGVNRVNRRLPATQRFGWLRPAHNNTPIEPALAVPGGFTLSATANLVRVTKLVNGQPCTAFLGVGHLHRGLSEPRLRKLRPHQRRRLTGKRAAFGFGYDYVHFFYTLEGRHPFRILAASGEFCLASAQDPTDCESVQFVTSLLPVAAAAGSPPATESLHLAWGVNDCEARHATLPMADVWDALLPLPQIEGAAAKGVCTPES